MKKNILIIGSTGFIGKNIVEDLLDNNHNIFLLVRNLEKAHIIFEVGASVTILEGDLKDHSLTQKIVLDNKIDLVIHLASSLIPSSSIEDFNKELTDIVFPTFELLEFLSINNIMIVYFSSGGTIYGKVNDKITENNDLKPINYYGYSKLMIENHIRFLNRTKNLSFLILRPSNVYGRYQRIEGKQGFIAVVLGKFLSKGSIEIWGDGEVVRDYIDVQDVSEGLKNLIKKNVTNRIFNLGSGEGKSLNEVLSIIENTLEKKIEVSYMDKRNIDVDRMILDVNAIKKHIDFNPKDLKTGIKNFIETLI
jgi:UDP-glucose 4-epimerase